MFLNEMVKVPKATEDTIKDACSFSRSMLGGAFSLSRDLLLSNLGDVAEIGVGLMLGAAWPKDMLKFSYDEQPVICGVVSSSQLEA